MGWMKCSVRKSPVILADISLHGGAFSSKALELLGYKDGDFIPQETEVQYEEDGKIGYIVEGLFWPLFTDFVLTDDRMGNRQIIDKTIDTMQAFCRERIHNAGGYDPDRLGE